MKKNSWAVYALLGLAVIFLVRGIVVKLNPVQLEDEKYSCTNKVCTYEFKLINKGNTSRKGQVWVKAYKKGGIQSEVALSKNIENYNLNFQESIMLQGAITSAETIEYVRFILVSQ